MLTLKKRFPSLQSLGSDGNTSFLRAARAGNLEKVLEHLKNNIDINTSNANGLNALHLASKDGHVSVVSELLARGATVDAATKKGNTALHIASLAGQEEVVKLLIANNASVNVQSQNGFTPLYMAAQENHDSVVRLLLSNGANQSLATEDGFTPLAVAMQQGHDKVVAVLLESDTRGKVRLPALHIAAKKDDVKAATLLLENDHNPDVTSKSGFTPLHIASHYGNEAMANLLIQKGADVNYAAKHNISPLHVAAKWGKTNMVALLLEKGASIESKTRDGLTPLHCAARSGHEQVVDMLLERGAPISAKTKNGLAPLHMAAQGEHVDAARILLYHRAPVDEVTVDYLTALHVAAHCGHVRVAKLLLDRNADANARALNGFTPLHIACKKNRIKVVELLLKHGASISATTESGLTPLHVASFMGCMNIVIYLLQHDASPDVPTVRGETPLHLAARANQTDIIRILLRNGAQVDARAREQQTPLHIASRLGNVDIVMLLLQHGAQVDAVTKDMYTALHIAAKEGQDEVAGTLLENDAQIDASTKKGFTPLHLTAKYGHIKVAELLLNKNAPVDAQGKNGVTPLHVASHYDNQNVALLLLEKGASPHATAKNGHTPLHIAARKNQMSIATTLLQYGANANAESKAGFTPLHLSSQEGHHEMSALLLESKANPDHQARNGLMPLHLCAQEDRVNVAQVLVKHGADTQAATKAGYTPLHVASHFGQANMVRYLIQQGVDINSPTGIGYTPLHQASQQGHCHIVNILLENNADPNAITNNGQTSLKIAQKLGYISVLDSLKSVTDKETTPEQPPSEEKYRVVAPEAMHETFMSDSEEEGGEDTVLSDQPYRYLTVDEMKSLGDDSLPIDVTRDERHDSNKMTQSTDSHQFPPTAMEDSISPQHMSMVQSGISVTDFADNINIERQSHIGKLHWKNFLVSFLVDARGGAMRGCRHSGVRIIVPPRSAAQPTRITCRYVKPQRTLHPPPLMEGEALASRVLELGPVGAKFLGPVIMEVPHFASLRGKEREIVILRSDNGETWREHNIDMSDEIIHDVLNDCFEAEDLAQLDELGGGRICRFVTYDFPQYFAVISRIRQEVHAIGPEGGMVSSTVVPQVQAVFPQGALTKKIKVGLQAQPIDPDLTAKMLGRGVAVSPVVTVEPRRRKFHKAITLSMPAPRAHSQGMINQYSGNAPTLRLLCSITGGTTRAQWEDVTGSTPLTFVNDCVSFTTTVSARFWLMDCRNIADATKMATELYKEAIHVPFMAKFVVFAKRTDPLEARLRVFCMTDDREDKTLEHQEHFTEVAKSRDVEVLEDKPQYIELAGNLVPITKSGEQLSLAFKAFRENRLPFAVRVKDQHADIVGRTLFMREPKIAKGEPPQQPICILNIVLPETIIPDHTTTIEDSQEIVVRVGRASRASPRDQNYLGELRVVDISNLLGEDWVKLAPEIGISETDVENIIAQNPTSSAQQAQAMLKQFQSKAKNDFNILENGLRTIARDDIVERCLRSSTTTTTTTVTMRNKTAFSISKRSHDVDILAESESIAKLVQKEDNQYAKEESSKYSVEEKRVEESEESEEETIKKTVAERRKQIEKRLSADRSIPASTQKREIVEEIITIKRSSVIDDTRAKHEEEILMQKPIDNSYKSTVIPEPVVKLKTTHLKDGSSVPKDEFDKELQDKFKSTLKNVDEFEHKSQVLEATEKVDTSAKIVDEIVKKDVPEFKPKVDELKPKDDKKKPDDHDDEGKPPVPKERVPVPTKRTSVSLEDDTPESSVVNESIKNIQDKISSFETKSSDSSKRTSWAKESSMGSKQWSEEQEIFAQKAQLEATETKWTEEDEIRAQQKEFEQIDQEKQQLELKKEQWSEGQEILAQKAQLEAAEIKWTEEDEIRAQQKQFEQITEEQTKKLEAAEVTRVQWTEEDEIRTQQKEFERMAEDEQSKQPQKKSEEEIKPKEVKEEIMAQKEQLEEMEHAVEDKLGKWAQEEIHEMETYKQEIEHIAEEQMKHQKELIEEKFEKMEEEFLAKVAEEKKELFNQFEQKVHAQEHAFQDMKNEGRTKVEKMEQQFQQTKSEVFSKVEEKVTSVTSKAESFAESFKTDAKKIEGLGDGFRQEVQEFTTQSSETKTFVDQKVDRTVKEIRDSEVVSEVKESTQQSKAAIDKAAEAVAKETVTSSEHVEPSVQEAFTKESFASVREEVISKDLAGTLKESAEKTKTEVETGIRQGDELIAEIISEIGEEFRRMEESTAIKPDEKPSIVETVKKTVTQEVTSKIPVLSKRTSPDEPTKLKEEPKQEKDVEPPMESIIEAAQTVVKHVEAAVSKIPRFHESTKPAAAHKPETSDVKSPEHEVTFSKIPILRDRKSSEQFSSDSCETVIMQKTLREQDSLLKSDSDEKPAPASVPEECEEITSKEVKEVLSFTTIDESVLNELITEDERAVTPDDFIDEIIEAAQDKVQLMQDTEIAAYTLDLSKSEDDAQQKSPHPIPEYVRERFDHEDEYDDHDEHEKWQDDKQEEETQASASFEETDTQPQTEITIPKPTPRSQSNLTAEADASSAATTSVATTTTTATTTSSAAAVASSLTTSSALATNKTTDEASIVETTDHDKPGVSGEASELSSSQEPLPVPRPRTSISSRTDTQTRSSIIESFDQPEDSIEHYPEPSSQRQESIVSEDFSGAAQKDSVEFETSDEDLSATKFYIGERSSDVIMRSSSEKRSDYAFDNIGYEYSQESGADDEPPQDPFKAYREKVNQEDSFTLKQLQEVETGTSLDEEIKAEVIEIIEGVADQSKTFELDLEKPIDAPRQPVVHSPIQPQVAKLVESAKPSTQKPSESDEPSQPEVIKRTIDELAIEKTLEEVKESLDAVHEELIESVVDGKLIKQSPSEFEFKVLPSTKYSQDPIYEAQQEEAIASTAPPAATADLVEPVTTTTIISEPIILTETKADSFEQKTSDPESKETSYESARPDGPTPISSDSSFAKLDVSPRMRKSPHHPKGTRWSATDIDSSGESQYQSFEQTDSSRPQSSDVDNLMQQYASSEYETALDNSIIPPSTEYHSAASTLNSFNVSTHDSLKSFDSESSGNLASIESEATETLVPSTMDIDFDSSDAAALIHDDSEDDLRDKLLLDDKDDLSSVSVGIPVAMKRSQEMHFTVDLMEVEGSKDTEVFQLQEEVEERLAQEQSEKLSSSIGHALDLMESMKASSLEDVKTECIDDIKLGTSLEDGSILSISLSSASNLETIMENLPDQGAGSLPTHMEIGVDAITPIVGTAAEMIRDITLTSTVVREGDVNFLNTQATMEMAAAKEATDESAKKRGHKRTESTISGQLMSEIAAEARDSLDSQEESVSLEASKQSSVERDETREESSDSDYDRYESEYSRSFRAPLIQSQKKKKDKVNEGYEMEVEHDRRNSFSPSSSVIETIVEDVHEEIEQGDEAQQLMEIKKEQLQEYQQTSATSIPDIQVTEDVQMEESDEEPVAASYSAKPMERETSDHKIQYAVQEEFKISEEQYQELIDQKYKSKMADITTKFDFEADDKEDSAGSDSFEMLEQPDISDEFVIVEEVAREAHECDMEGKSVSIQPVKMEKKHDEEVEKMLVKSAPAHTNAGSLYANMREDMMYAFEDSPPTGSEEVDPNAVTMDLLNNGYPLEESKRWVEMQLAETQNYRYPYDERLEDIKEEDEVGSSRIGSIKDSFSSTPDYDMLAKRLASRGGEHDDISMSSLQEFESLEQVISLENRKMQQGSQDSLSNGSFTRRFLARGGHGDDISLSSLKEFEGLETACLEAHLIEIKAKEEAALLLSRSDESNKSDRSNGAKKSPPTNGTVVRATTSSTTVSSGPEQQATKVETKVVTTQMSKDSLSTTTTATTVTTVSHESQVRHALEEEDTSHLLTVSSDSLDGNRIQQQQTISKDTLPSAHSSSDSLEINNRNNVDLMTSSIDSIEFSRAGAMTTRSSRSDSIEQMALQQPQRSDSTDSIEMQHAVMSRASETKRDSLESLPYSIENKSTSSSPTKPATGQRMTAESVMMAGSSSVGFHQTGMSKDISIDSLTGQDAFLTSTESLETSSTATNATYQNETDSQMSSSVTSCGSITMVDTLDNLGDLEGFGLQESMTFQSSSSSTMVTASTSSSGQQQQQQQHQQQMQQQQHQQMTTQVLRSSTSSTTSTSSANTRGEFSLAEIELLSRQMYPGDLTFDDAKESAKEKLQSKTTEKED